jgi:hypothetical protein
LTRRTAIQTLAGAATAPLVKSAETKSASPRWALQYFYDKDQETFQINDFRLVTASHGIAVGWVTERKGKLKPMSVITTNGGVKWDPQPLPDVGLSTFFLNDSLGWLVGEKGIYRTEEGGRDWKKISKLKNNVEVNRVYFKDENHGWAACQKKIVLETKDGGKSWDELKVASEPNATPEYTSYNWIEFVTPKDGMIVGSSVPPRPGENQPAWMDPEGASKRREWPTLTITLETRDGGETWKPQTAPAFGQATRFRTGSTGSSVVLIRFSNAFEWPSEVYLVKQGKAGTRIYRQSDRVVTDCAWLAPGRVVLAAIEPPGKLHQLPIPGKLHMLTSDDMTTWTEMKVDYRAFGNNALLSVPGPDLGWVATDTGQIFRLTN